ncbi:MAG: electron transfer flavoprotein subunit alpha/FixB family protein [Firmicutes bacterium]|nr:electron transfer flavoprotein subunit alpha/FixB family protein [Bacillota bacterium]
MNHGRLWAFTLVDDAADRRWENAVGRFAETEWGAKFIDEVTLIMIGAVPPQERVSSVLYGMGSAILVKTAPFDAIGDTIQAVFRALADYPLPSVSVFLVDDDWRVAMLGAFWSTWLKACVAANVSSFRVMPDGSIQVVQDVEVGVTQAVTTYRPDEKVTILWDIPHVSTPPRVRRQGDGLRLDAITVPDVNREVEVIRLIEPTPQELPLEDAERVVAGGRGIEGPDGFAILEELATCLRAGLGASRVAVDQGWISYAHQVGQSGKRIHARLYMAFGISGAPQHLDGMKDCETIVAINRDPKAPIFDVAHLAVVADAREVARQLTLALRARESEEHVMTV